MSVSFPGEQRLASTRASGKSMGQWVCPFFLIVLATIAVLRITSTYNVFNHTWDEPAHIAAGMEWLDRGTYLYEPHHPPLARIAAALAPFITGIRLSAEQDEALTRLEMRKRDPKRSAKAEVCISEVETKRRRQLLKGQADRWIAGEQILWTDGLYFRNLSLARLGILPFLLLGIGVVSVWARTLFGDSTAVIATILVTTSPAILGHAGLATTDMAFAATFVSAIFSFVFWLEAPTLNRSFLLGLTSALAVLSKFSALLFLPSCVAAILILRWVLRNRSVSVRPSSNSIGSRRMILGHLALAAFVGFFILWAGYRFSTSPLSYEEWRPHDRVDKIVGVEGPLHDLAYFIFENVPLPMPDLFSGIQQVRAHNKRGHPAYLMGDYSSRGWWYYYFVAIAIKTPIGILVLACIGCIVLARRTYREGHWQMFVPCLAVITILFVTIPVHINIGSRHVLPIFFLLAIPAGFGALYLWGLKHARILGRIAAAALLGWHLFSSALSHPDYLAYFNEFAQAKPERYMADTDLDWGQDLYRLSAEISRRSIPKINLAYLGTADPELFNLPPTHYLEPHHSATGWIAISICKQKDVFGPPPHDGYAWLDEFQPVTTVGKSIKLFYIPEVSIPAKRSW